MIRSPPGTRRAGVANQSRRTHLAVSRLDDIRNDLRVDGRTGGAIRPPVMAVPPDDLALIIGGDRHLGEGRRAVARDLQFRGAVEHQLDRLAGLLRQDCGGDVPFVDGKLRAETAAHVLAVNLDVRLVHTQRIDVLTAGARDVLRGKVRHELTVLELGMRPMRLQTHMGDGVNAVQSVVDMFGLADGTAGITGHTVTLRLGESQFGRECQVELVHKVIEYLVIDLHRTGPFCRLGRTLGCYSDDRFSLPADLVQLAVGRRPTRKDIHPLDARHLLRGGYVDRLDACVGMR